MTLIWHHCDVFRNGSVSGRFARGTSTDVNGTPSCPLTPCMGSWTGVWTEWTPISEMARSEPYKKTSSKCMRPLRTYHRTIPAHKRCPCRTPWFALTHWGRDKMAAILQATFLLNENNWISNRISLKFVPKVPIENTPALVQVMAWRRPGDKPLSESMMLN